MPYQLMPDLTEDEYAALKADIAKRGILVPIELDEHGTMLDGHHRLQAWQELRDEGIKLGDYPRIIRSGMTEQEKRNYVRVLNLLRRQLSKEQCAEQWDAMRADGMTYQAIADMSGVDDETVRSSISDSVLENSETEVATILGKDGKQYPAHRKKQIAKPIGIFASDARQERQAREAAQKLDTAPAKILTVRRAARIAREQEAERQRKAIQASGTEEFSVDSVTIRHGDFRNVLSDVDEQSVSLIFTDPPYGKSSLPLWNDLGSWAARVLVPGGFLVSYSGQTYLPSVIEALSEHLRYVWMMAQLSKGPKSIMRHVGFYSAWKPLLLFARSPFAPCPWGDDVIRGPGPEKQAHDWQQSEYEASYCIGRFSKAGQLIADPFLGSGTSAVAAMKLGRRFIGADIDGAAISKALGRLRE